MNEFMFVALDEARKGIRKGHGGPFGAVIVRDQKVVAKAHNTVLKDKDSTCHAELSAIKKACKKLKSFDLSGCEIYTTGRPCPMCRSAIQWAKISKVFFGCDYEEAKKIGFDELSGNSFGYEEVILDSKECEDLYMEYGSSERRSY